MQAEIDRAAALDAMTIMLNESSCVSVAPMPDADGQLASAAADGSASTASEAPTAPDAPQPSIGDAIKSSLRGATHAAERIVDDVSIAVSSSLNEPIAVTLANRAACERETLRVSVRLRPAKLPLGRRSERLSCAHGPVRVRGAVRGASPATYQMDALLEELAPQSVA